MTPATIIRGAQEDGVTLAVIAEGTIKAIGNGDAVNRWLPLIREQKPGVLAALQGAATDDTLAGRVCSTLSDPERQEGYKQADIDKRRHEVMTMLDRDPTWHRATKAFTEADPENVIFAIAKRGKWYVELVAPKPVDPFRFISMAVQDEE